MNNISMDKGKVFDVIVKPKSKKSEIIFKENKFFALLKAMPIKGEANKELQKIFFKTFKHHIDIKSGKTSKTKKIIILD